MVIIFSKWIGLKEVWIRLFVEIFIGFICFFYIWIILWMNLLLLFIMFVLIIINLNYLFVLDCYLKFKLDWM